MPESGKVTELLQEVHAGDAEASAKLFQIAYDQLKGMAHARIERMGKGRTIQTTDLVHESFLRLVGSDSSWENRRHFFGAAARAMRNVLVDAARKHRQNVSEVEDSAGPLLEAVVTELPLEDILLVDEVLTRLAEQHPRHAQVVNLRYFAGLALPEIAEILDVSLSTAERDWRFARAWLQEGDVGGRSVAAMSNPERRRRLEELFDLGTGLPPAEHAAFAERHCGNDEVLGRELVALLAEDAQGTGELLARDPLHPIGVDEERVGVYRLLELLGEGGMGSVHLAEQEEPIRRRVALKRIRLGTRSAETLARFAAERQTMALMNHPGIARIFDGGVTESGLPYFVMEYVPGSDLTSYCDRVQATLAQRLALFGLVCDAVQHAHQKGVVHRDLKPSNVLVTEADGEARPKVIDFGIAASLSEPDYRAIGTPEFMSPEQADSRRSGLDTRADIYSLGAILRELTSSLTPPGGEVAAIVAKSMAREPAARYASVSELRADVDRYRRGFPVVAVGRAPLYVAARFARRHWIGMSCAAGVAAVVLFATVAHFANRGQLHEAVAAERHAASKSEAIVEFLNHALFNAHPLKSGADLSVREMLELSEPDIAAMFRGEPAAEAAVRTTLGNTHLYFGEEEAARDQLRAAYELLLVSSPDAHYDLFLVLNGLIKATRRLAGTEAAAPYVEHALEIATARLRDRRPELALSAAAMLELAQGDAVDEGKLASLNKLMDALPHAAQRGDETLLVGRLLVESTRVLLERGHEASGAALEALESHARELLPPDHISFLDFLWILTNAQLYEDHEDYVNAERLARELEERARKVLPAGHWLRGDAKRLLGQALAGQGQEVEAETLLLATPHEISRQGGSPRTRARWVDAALAAFAETLEPLGIRESWDRWREGDRSGAWWLVARPGLPQGVVEAALKALEGLEMPDARWHRGLGLYRLGRFASALEVLEAVDPAEETWSAHAFRTLALHRLGRKGEARSELDRLRARPAAEAALLREVERELGSPE